MIAGILVNELALLELALLELALLELALLELALFELALLADGVVFSTKNCNSFFAFRSKANARAFFA